MTAMVAGRVITALAAIALLGVVLLNVAPARAESSSDESRSRTLDCGTFLLPGEHSFSDSCEDVRIGRLMTTMVLWLGSLPLGIIGLVLLYRAVRDG